jgi:3-oxoacyl-[acyl-carrier-protein] synthase-1
MNPPIVVRSVGMVTSVGLNALATCAAIRAGVRNMSSTRFVGASDEPLFAAQVPLPKPWRGQRKLVKLLAASVSECIEYLPPQDWKSVPLLICLAETGRPGRPEDIDESILSDLEAEIGIQFSRESTGIVALGRVGGLVALAQARALMLDRGFQRVLIAGVDSLLVRQSLAWLRENDRLLTPENSNGFIPGEAAGCVLLERDGLRDDEVICLGVGLAQERVTIDSEEPFRADGLSHAVSAALAEARIDISECALRLTDLSGEHYYFRETALTLSRLLRHEGCRELWHPAECIGEVGAAIGPILLGYAAVAARKRFLPGPRLLIQSSGDDGMRAAACLSVVGDANVQ